MRAGSFHGRHSSFHGRLRRRCFRLHQAHRAEFIEKVARTQGITLQRLIQLNPHLKQQALLHKDESVCVWGYLERHAAHGKRSLAPLVMALPLLGAVVLIIAYTQSRRDAQAPMQGNQPGAHRASLLPL